MLGGKNRILVWMREFSAIDSAKCFFMAAPTSVFWPWLSIYVRGSDEPLILKKIDELRSQLEVGIEAEMPCPVVVKAPVVVVGRANPCFSALVAKMLVEVPYENVLRELLSQALEEFSSLPLPAALKQHTVFLYPLTVAGPPPTKVPRGEPVGALA